MVGNWVFRFIVWAALGIIFIYNIQPWLNVGAWVADSIAAVPFDGFLFSLPVIKQIVESIWNNLISIVAIVLWFFVQFCQVMALCVESKQAQNAMRRLFGISLDTSDKVANRRRRILAGCAYALETVVCFIEYPPYVDGLSGIINDLWVWDPYYIQWGQLVEFAITMGAFEGFLWLILFFATGSNPSTKASSSSGGSSKKI